jgi:hypothetical protein
MFEMLSELRCPEVHAMSVASIGRAASSPPTRSVPARAWSRGRVRSPAWRSLRSTWLEISRRMFLAVQALAIGYSTPWARLQVVLRNVLATFRNSTAGWKACREAPLDGYP